VRRFLFENSLSLFFGVLFAGALVGQSIAGQRVFNEEEREHGGEPVSWLDYVLSSEFGQAVMENWQSEYLQFTLYVYATVWLVQKGSNESKPLDDVGLESDQKQKVGGYAPENGPLWAKVGGLRTAVYENSLLLVMTMLFLSSWLVQSLTAWRSFAAEQREHGEPALSWSGYLGNSDFWERTLQNWQSEFLAIGTMVIFSVYLRQRGSPESKPVGAPHAETGSSG
jgi:uncharacterized protein DUF6766